MMRRMWRIRIGARVRIRKGKLQRHILEYRETLDRSLRHGTRTHAQRPEMPILEILKERNSLAMDRQDVVLGCSNSVPSQSFVPQTRPGKRPP